MENKQISFDALETTAVVLKDNELARLIGGTSVDGVNLSVSETSGLESTHIECE